MDESIFNKIKDRYYLHRYVFPFVRRNENRVITKENTICLFSHPRGGSTWLAEILLQIPHSCLIDEPLQPGKIKSPGLIIKQNYRNAFNVEDRRFYDEQPIPLEADWPDAENLVANIMKGKIDSLSFYEDPCPKRLINAETYIIKFNFGHLMANWLVHIFSVNAILLTRHPCAVVASQLKLKIFKETDFEKQKDFPDFKYIDVIEKYDHIYKSIKSFEEYLAFMWSIKVKETLYNKSDEKRWLNVVYEYLLTDFDGEIRRIFKWIDRELPDRLDALQFHPSSSTKPHSLERIKTKQQVTAWKNELSKKQIKEILGIVEKFEIDIYTDAPEPDYDKLYNL